MINIGVNGNEANVRHRVGVGQYAFELLKAISGSTDRGLRSTVYLSSDPLPDMPPETDKWQYKVFGPKKLWTLTGLQKKLLEEKAKGHLPNVFFTPSHYTPLYMPLPSVISIMDLAFEKFSEYFTRKDYLQLKYWTQASVMIASKILTISEHTKKDICAQYAVSPDKVVVTYPGYDAQRFNAKVKSQKTKVKSTIKKYKIAEPYLIYLGTLQPRKNLVRLVEAFSRIKKDNYQLVLTGMIHEGRGGWMYQDIFDKVKELGLEKRVIFTGYVPDEVVPYLLAGSTTYVLPSLYEGFGIPPIEAMATGVPVVVSKVSSLPEICGEAPIYIDNPYKSESVLKALESGVNMKPTERERRVNLGLAWVKRYNWESTAKRTLEVLQEAARS